jgi:hypothetical protein
MTKTLLRALGITALLSSAAHAQNAVITGTVQSKCSIFTEIQGVYGNPTPNELSTLPADGGVNPVIRFDVAAASYYTGRISYPTAFSSSPSLADSVAWTGDVTVAQVSDPNMAGYESAKVQYNNVTEYDLTVAGSTWFTVDSAATYGFNSSFPAGTYTSIVVAECIPQ